MRNIKLSDAERDLLKTAFSTTVTLPQLFLDELISNWEAVTFKRKQAITTAGETERYLYYVVAGVQRCYSTFGDKEATIVFTYANSFGGVIDSFLLQRPSASHFESLTDSRLLRISYTSFMKAVDANPLMEKWLRIALSHVVAGLLERQTELSAYSAAEKLNTLFKRSPHIFNLIPHKYLASYVGVDPATFSKMLGKVNP